ncbi:hypothetical protein OG948_18035 [Embleya sp. NBC_00888]|uniref:hypothetical protein n=1 Tax=Embleya sp. NBC_00888 TaxID=2975960 RepID=UPI00386FC44D|nr:hypothetical protein OG948_18035 [Embleya sp. NBC_00888]
MDEWALHHIETATKFLAIASERSRPFIATDDYWSKMVLQALEGARVEIERLCGVITSYAVNEAGVSNRECAEIAGVAPNTLRARAASYAMEMDDAKRGVLAFEQLNAEALRDDELLHETLKARDQKRV